MPMHVAKLEVNHAVVATYTVRLTCAELDI